MVGLGVALEDLLLVFGGDADAGVVHTQVQPALTEVFKALFVADLQADFALLGEFDRIAQQVDQHLCQPVAVAHGPWGHILGQVERVADLFALRPALQDGPGCAQCLVQVEGHMHHLQLARFDL